MAKTPFLSSRLSYYAMQRNEPSGLRRHIFGHLHDRAQIVAHATIHQQRLAKGTKTSDELLYVGYKNRTEVIPLKRVDVDALYLITEPSPCNPRLQALRENAA